MNFHDDLGRVKQSDWGPWKLDRENTHVYRVGAPECHLDLNDLSSHLLLRTLRELESQVWADNECLGGLMRASFAIRRALVDIGRDSPHQT